MHRAVKPEGLPVHYMRDGDFKRHDFYVKPDAALVLARAISRAARTMKKPYRLFPPPMTERDV